MWGKICRLMAVTVIIAFDRFEANPRTILSSRHERTTNLFS